MDLTRCYGSFSMIQTVAKWAAVIGGIQSVAWIILSIISILMYCCIFELDKTYSYGSITKFVLFEMYFRGNCQLDALSNVKFGELHKINTVLNSWQILIWACVYLGVSLIWLVSSCLLLTHVKKSNIKLTIAILCTWAGVTLFTCCMDLSLGVIFGVDFSRYQWKAYQLNLDDSQAGVVETDPKFAMIIAAEYSAFFMMFIALKGFVLWLVNFGLMIYLFTGAYVAQDIVHDYINHTFNNTHHPTTINAFEPKDDTGFDNAAFVVEQQRPPPHRSSPVELNEGSIKRAAIMSTDNLKERRFRNIDSFEQYPPPRPQQLPQQHPPQLTQMISNEPIFPAPDYTPPMPRSNQNGQIRNTRYQ